MGKSGLEMIKVFPDALPQESKNEITIKSMPLGAKEVILHQSFSKMKMLFQDTFLLYLLKKVEIILLL